MNDQFAPGPIARRVLESLRRQMRMKVADLGAFRVGREHAAALQDTVTSREQLAETHPAHAIYIHAQNQMSVMAEQLLQLSEMKSFVKQIGSAEDEYMPSWPPMSPISKSFFVCWSTYDLPVGARHESVGTVTIAVAKECGTDSKLLALMQRLQESRMGIYQVERQDGVQVRLRDLVTDKVCVAICQSGYCGSPGELWYARVLPPPAAGAHHVVLTSPYVLIGPDLTAWTAYLDRVAAKAPGTSRASALEQHFKWGDTSDTGRSSSLRRTLTTAQQRSFCMDFRIGRRPGLTRESTVLPTGSRERVMRRQSASYRSPLKANQTAQSSRTWPI